MFRFLLIFLPLLVWNFIDISTYCASDNLEKQKKKGIILVRIGLCGDYPPFEYQTRLGDIVGKNRKVLEGLFVLIKQEYHDKYEIKVEYKKIGFEEGFLLLKNGNLDILAASVSPSKKREENFSFIGPVFYTKMCMVQKKKEEGTIAVQIGSLQEEYAYKFYPNNKIISVPLVLDMISLYKNGRVDSMILNTHVYNYFNKLTSLEGTLLLLDSEEKIGFALRKKLILSNKFDQIIAPKILEIFKRYEDNKKSTGKKTKING